jgi:hypothetical protein
VAAKSTTGERDATPRFVVPFLRNHGFVGREEDRTNTEPGSSGSPCFDQDWGLVALHHAGDPDFSFGHAAAFNEGIPFGRIVAHLARPGVGVVLPPLPG